MPEVILGTSTDGAIRYTSGEPYPWSLQDTTSTTITCSTSSSSNAVEQRAYFFFPATTITGNFRSARLYVYVDSYLEADSTTYDIYTDTNGFAGTTLDLNYPTDGGDWDLVSSALAEAGWSPSGTGWNVITLGENISATNGLWVCFYPKATTSTSDYLTIQSNEGTNPPYLEIQKTQDNANLSMMGVGA